jgi:5-methylthioadenosine/S-adenosylhomocysteine deaminase
MNIRFYNARILSMNGDFTITTGEVIVCGDRIHYVGAPAAHNLIFDREIDCEKNLLMPGFKNAHTHSAMTFLRSYADDLPLSSWLNDKVFPLEAKLTAEHIYHLSVLAIMEYLTSGITSNFDMYFTPETIAQAALDTGFRTVMTGALNNFTHSLQELEDWHDRFNNGDERISFILGFHAEYTNSLENLEGLAALAHKLRAPVFTHCSETAEEVSGCIERHGITPPALFDRLDLFRYGGGAYHCVHITEEDLDIFAASNLSIVTNPASNLKLASGIAPIQRMLDKGINVAIGTDGPASNNCLDFFREMFLVTGLAKAREEDAAAVDAFAVLEMAVRGGAIAMGLSDCDCLAPGKLADIILIDLKQPNMQPLNNIAKNIVYSGSKQNVTLTMVNGRILYENGHFHIGIAPEQVYAKVNEITQMLTR